jgi:hypothetical protein
MIFPDSFNPSAAFSLLEVKRLNTQTGYVGMNNSPGYNNLIKDFDHAIDGFMRILLCRRNKPIINFVSFSGGSSSGF